MSKLQKLLRRLSDDESGTTLIEAMVVMALTLLILGLATATLILGQRQTGASGIRLDNSAQSRVGIESLTKNLRTAVLPSQLNVANQTCQGAASICGTTMVTSATSTGITFFANVNDDLSSGSTAIGPSKVTYSVVKDPSKGWGNLVETVQPATAVAGAPGVYTYCTPGVAGCVVRSRIICRGLAFPATTIFTYYDPSGNVITTNPVSGSDLGRIDSVDVTLVVRTSAAYGTPGTTVTQRVALPNSDVNVNPSASPGA